MKRPTFTAGWHYQGLRVALAAVALAVAAGSILSSRLVAGNAIPNFLPFPNPSGFLSTYSTAGGIDLSNPFFKSIGTNGRSCASCHQPSDGWTVTPTNVQRRFLVSGGLDPIFRTNDGSDCPSANVSTVAARRAAYSMLLSKAVIRISLPVPTNADFSVTTVQDPHPGSGGTPCPETTQAQLAMFRRPLPAANLRFLSAVMWDGRESAPAAPAPVPADITGALGTQAIDATLGHAQGPVLTADQLNQIVSFETSLYAAQVFDFGAGWLGAEGATGGPLALSGQDFFLGINDPIGLNPTGAPFNSAAFNIYDNWSSLTGNDFRSRTRESVARGQAIFNNRPIAITGVAGLNDRLNAPTIGGFCTTCHNSPNAGDHSISMPLDIGISDYPARSAALNISGLPVYTILCSNGTQIQTTDPGRAMISGKCTDLRKFKGPILRGLAARAPYFHNGSATRLIDVVNFYNDRFNLSLTDQEKADLVAFLRTL